MSKLNIKNLKAAIEKGQVFYDGPHNVDDDCEHCGRLGWSYLIAIVPNPKALNGALQNAKQIWAVGTGCFRNIKREVGGKWKTWEVEND